MPKGWRVHTSTAAAAATSMRRASPPGRRAGDPRSWRARRPRRPSAPVREPVMRIAGQQQDRGEQPVGRGRPGSRGLKARLSAIANGISRVTARMLGPTQPVAQSTSLPRSRRRRRPAHPRTRAGRSPYPTAAAEPTRSASRSAARRPGRRRSASRAGRRRPGSPARPGPQGDARLIVQSVVATARPRKSAQTGTRALSREADRGPSRTGQQAGAEQQAHHRGRRGEGEDPTASAPPNGISAV